MQPEQSNNVYAKGTIEDKVTDELDVFLRGLNLKELIPRFHSQKVAFQAFLQMTDSDLCQLGVCRAELRKCILDAIEETHMKRLRHCSSKPLQYNKKISCSESTAMLANIRRHLGFVGSSIGYISSRVNEDKLIVLDSPDPIHIYELCSHTERALMNMGSLYQEIVEFRKQLQELYPVKEFTAKKLVEVSQTSKVNWKRALFLCGGTLSCIGTIYMFSRC